MKPALVTGAFQDILCFTIVQLAAQVGTFSRKGPAKITFIEKNEISSNEISSKRQLSGDFHVVWFFRDAVASESYNGI